MGSRIEATQTRCAEEVEDSLCSPAPGSELQIQSKNSKMPWRAETKGGGTDSSTDEGKESPTGKRWER